MIPVEQALVTILASVVALPSVMVPLDECCGSVLAEDIFSDTDVPPFDNSAVDGYAVRSSDFETSAPVSLHLIGTVAAGAIDLPSVLRGSCVRIMTGAEIPPGADAVVMHEDTRLLGQEHIEVLAAPLVEQHVRRTGRDVRAGERVLARGEIIRPAEVAMLATAGYAEVCVTRKPRVAIVTTGDELVPVERGAPPQPGQIRDSNRYALAALARRAGAVVEATIHVRDDLVSTIEALRSVSAGDAAVDLILVAGGVSVGERDFVKPAIERLGRIGLWRVRMKPGKPLAFGTIGRTLVLGLPGNPASAMVTFELFAVPLLMRLSGRSERELAPTVVQARLMERIEHVPGRREYVRAVTHYSEGRFTVRVAGDQGSAMIGSMTRANSLLIVPDESIGADVGEMMEVILTRAL